jgi:glycosyltransferase involved in cell wall biosynthesis
VVRPSCFGVPPRPPAESLGSLVVPFADVKQWLLSGRIVRHLARHPAAELATHRLAHLSKPFPTALLVRALSRGSAAFSDDAGERVELGARTLLLYFAHFARDLARIPALFASSALRARSLGQRAAAAPATTLDLARPPLYLRADLHFGLRAGGSVAHVAGVLNNLGRFAAAPVFVTTDRVPTVSEGIETHLVLPGPDFCGYEEMPAIHFSKPLEHAALAAIAGRAVSFVYQRYALYNMAGAELALRLRAPFVLEYNGSEVWIARNWGRPLTYERLARTIEDALLAAAHLVVVVSRPIRDELVARGIPEARILVNPNGVDAERYSPEVDGSQVRRRHGLEGRRVLGFIGTFGRWHGAEVLADAFGRLLQRRPEWRDDVRLLIVGDGVTRPETERRLRGHGVLDQVVLTGSVPQHEGPAHLAACDVLVSPHAPNADGSTFFGSPTKVFEYMAMGRGIAASNLGQIGEVLRHEETALLTTPGDAQSLAAACERLLEDESLARRLGEAARRDVVARYTWTVHTRRIVEALAEALHTAPRAAS